MSEETAQVQTTATTTDKPWYDGVDADTIGYLQNKKWDANDGPRKVLEGYRNLEKLHGVPAEQILKLPTDDNPEAWSSVYSRLGRPETPDKYGMDNIKVPEGVSLDTDRIAFFDSIMHKHGLSTAQRNNLVNSFIDYEQGISAERAKETEQIQAEQLGILKKEWGSKYDQRVALANQAFRSFLPDGVDKDQLSSFLENGLGSAIAVKLFANIADRMGEDKFNDDGDRTEKFGYTVEQATNDRNVLKNEITGDSVRLSNYNKGIGPDIEKMRRLNKIIAAG